MVEKQCWDRGRPARNSSHRPVIRFPTALQAGSLHYDAGCGCLRLWCRCFPCTQHVEPDFCTRIGDFSPKAAWRRWSEPTDQALPGGAGIEGFGMGVHDEKPTLALRDCCRCAPLLHGEVSQTAGVHLQNSGRSSTRGFPPRNSGRDARALRVARRKMLESMPQCISPVLFTASRTLQCSR